MTASASLADELMAQLHGAPLQQLAQQLAQQLGAGTEQTEQAVAAALPMMLGAMGQNAAQPQGANALFGALRRDHNAGGGFDLGGLLGGGAGAGNAAAAPDGAAILGHIFGDNQQRAETGLGQATGLGSNAGQLLKLLAPIVMAFLAQRVNAGGMDAGNLGQTLGQERERVQQQGGLGGDLLGRLLDQDGDGQLGMGDLLKVGGSLFGGRR